MIDFCNLKDSNADESLPSFQGSKSEDDDEHPGDSSLVVTSKLLKFRRATIKSPERKNIFSKMDSPSRIAS